MPTLFQISDDIRAFHDLINEHLENSCGEVTPEVEKILDDWFGQLGRDQNQKIDNYCALVNEMVARAKVRRSEMERLAIRVRVDENAAKSLRERLKIFLELQGMKKVETERYRVSVCGNGGKAPLEVLADPQELPAAYQKVRIEADTDVIREDLSSGKEIPGCRLLPRGTHLRIT